MFKRKQPEKEPEMTPTEYAAALRANAIEYIVSLKKAEKNPMSIDMKMVIDFFEEMLIEGTDMHNEETGESVQPRSL